jgi:transposase-like protein
MQLRNWVKAFADDPQEAFPGQGRMKPEQREVARLKREVLGESTRQPLRQRSNFQSDPLQVVGRVRQNRQQSLRFARDL